MHAATEVRALRRQERRSAGLAGSWLPADTRFAED